MLLLSRKLKQAIRITNQLNPEIPDIYLEITEIAPHGTRVKLGITADKDVYRIERVELTQQPNLLKLPSKEDSKEGETNASDRKEQTD